MEIDAQIAKLYGEAIKRRASDIYFLPFGNQYQIKIRDAQTLTTWATVSETRARRMINYCKYMADMAISENRRPQVGAMAWQLADKHYSLRLSSVGDFSGTESMVIRIIYDLQEIKTAFLTQEDLWKVHQVSKRRGLIIFSGPTDSGKTTSIYNLVNQIKADKVVMTIEDPVEIKQPDYLQLQVNHEAGMDYSDLIKVGLRHRPDIFIIGEIRDVLTAKAAVRAALSGHLVYSTIHAQSPKGVINRLLQLGVAEPFILQAVTAICYQRLIPVKSGERKALLKCHLLAELMAKTSYDWSEWQNELEEAVIKQQISRKTAIDFQFG